jgi:hypothetical protein
MTNALLSAWTPQLRASLKEIPHEWRIRTLNRAAYHRAHGNKHTAARILESLQDIPGRPGSVYARLDTTTNAA